MQKSARFGLVLTPNEKTAVTNLAELEGGLSQAALIRRLIHNAAKKHGLWSQIVKDSIYCDKNTNKEVSK